MDNPDNNLNKKKYQELRERNEKMYAAGGPEKIRVHHEKGKLTARERIRVLLDEHTFEEIGGLVEHRSTEFGIDKQKFPGDGVITGYGTIHGRLVYVYSQDFTVLGGSLSETHAEKICKILEMALKNGAPVVGLNESGGARIQEGVRSLAGYADIFYRNTRASGVIPQISAILGPCAGGAVYSPALTDFVFMVEETSNMFVTGPNVLKQVINEDVTFEELGGADVHTSKSGVAHVKSMNEVACLEEIRALISYFPQNCEDKPLEVEYETALESRPALDDLLPDNNTVPYDMRDVINEIVDRDSLFEIHKDFAENIVTGFGRIAGKSIGIVANQPAMIAGVLDINSSRKAARFVRFCDCFNIPILVLVDVPGFLPGKDQEWNGIISNGAKLLYAFCEATVPKITVITRKAYGGAYDVMNSKHIGADLNFAWPTAEIAVMGAKGAAEIIFRNEIKNADNPEKKLQEKVEEYAEIFENPYIAASRGFIDQVIFPRDTRSHLIKGFRMLENKVDHMPVKKHGNIPL